MQELPNFIVEIAGSLLELIGRFAGFVAIGLATLLISWWLIFRRR